MSEEYKSSPSFDLGWIADLDYLEDQLDSLGMCITELDKMVYTDSELAAAVNNRRERIECDEPTIFGVHDRASEYISNFIVENNDV
ncbi:MAG TPA: hypothetical protein ENJ34_01440, partial [Epsilonproteobacteria bacterium]|nr:hypothetical protein [Campylobacterota bacterium]